MKLRISVLLIAVFFTANLWAQTSPENDTIPPPPTEEAAEEEIMEEEAVEEAETERIEEDTTEAESSQANQPYEPDLKWGKVSDEYLKMKVFEPDTSAAVLLLLNYTSVEPGKNANGEYGVVYSHHYRIKVINKDNYQGGDFDLYSTPYNRVKNIRAQTINWNEEAGEVEKTKVKEILTDDRGEGRYVKRFSFPNIQNGSILEYRYEVFSKRRTIIDDFYYQTTVPVVWAEYRFTEINELKYKKIYMGDYDFFQETEKEVDENAIHDGGVEHRWIIKDLPARPKESYVTTIDNFLAKTSIQLETYEDYYGSEQYWIKDWDDYTEKYYYDEDVMGQVNNDKNLKKILKEIKPYVAQKNTDEEKIQVIYQFVQSQMHWTGDYTIYASDDLKKIYKGRVGRGADINLLLLGVLKTYGFRAYPALISTRSNGRIYKDFPLIQHFEHMIVYVDDIGDAPLFLDATHEDLPYNLLSEENLNGEALAIRNGIGQWLEIKPSVSKKVAVANMEINDEGRVAGDIEYLRDTYRAYDLRKYLEDVGYDDFKKSFFRGIMPEVEVQELKFTNENEYDKELIEYAEFSAENVGQVAGDLIYFDLLFGMGFSENPFEAETRDYPVELPYPLYDDYTFKIKIPEGYVLEEHPETVELQLPRESGSFTFVIEEKDGYVEYRATLDFVETNFLPEEYQTIRNFFDKVVETQTGQIVLKKK
jgi:hypothetical protein